MFSNEDYIAELLAEAGIVTEQQIQDARSALSGQETLVENLIANQVLTEQQAAQTLAANASVPFVNLSGMQLEPSVITGISDETAKRYKAVAIADDGSFLTVAVADPLDFEALDSLPHVIGRELNFACATFTQIKNHLLKFYNAGDALSAPVEDGFEV